METKKIPPCLLSLSEQSEDAFEQLWTRFGGDFERIRQYVQSCKLSLVSGAKQKRKREAWDSASEAARAEDEDATADKTSPTEVEEEAPNSKEDDEDDIRLPKLNRAPLPIDAFREEIIATVRRSQVTVICGETGCGKTTQVPQFLLDDAMKQVQGAGEGMGEGRKKLKLLCTQPRRISAIGVSERVAEERGEKIGRSIGYQIRLESKKSREHTQVLFVTAGILLRMLTTSLEEFEAPELGLGGGNFKDSKNVARKTYVLPSVMKEFTHIILDEVHERDRHTDFLLVILRDLLPLVPHVRLILMSATMQTSLFSKYFGGCPVVNVPGRTFEVRNVLLNGNFAISL